MRISNIGLLELEGMEFHAYHGCFEKEREEGNLFVVDLKAEMFIKDALKTDSLSKTVDYGDIYKVVRKEMETPSNLIEHVAGRIGDALAENFPELGKFTLRVSKKNPPVGGACGWSRITVRYPKDTMFDRPYLDQGWL